MMMMMMLLLLVVVVVGGGGSQTRLQPGYWDNEVFLEGQFVASAARPSPHEQCSKPLLVVDSSGFYYPIYWGL